LMILVIVLIMINITTIIDSDTAVSPSMLIVSSINLVLHYHQYLSLALFSASCRLVAGRRKTQQQKLVLLIRSSKRIRRIITEAATGLHVLRKLLRRTCSTIGSSLV
jgi:hypothetical protein